jgi:hypothetical protein
MELKMDNLKQVWDQLKKDSKDFTTFQEAEIESAIRQESHGLLATIRKKVFIKWLFCLFFTVLIAVGTPFVNVLASQVILLFLLVAYLFGSIMLWQEYQHLKHGIDMSKSLKEGLREYYDRVRKVLKYEEVIGLVLYPFSLSAGFFLGLSLGENPIMSQQKHWIALIICIIVFTPVGHFMAKWMNRKGFGKYMKQLKQNIDELEEL